MKTKGLGSKATLAKIDKLRELNVGSVIPLPQLVVVGDQSSGKSSVLESLTGFSFPRAAGLCTRYATQITCSRGPSQAVIISIIPRPDADDELKAKLLAFHRSFTTLDDDGLAKIFTEANEAMGIRMGEGGEGNAFSEDILKIEISGPEEVHLTVIDVPGIFRVPTPGLTTDADITLVENMVKSYMNNRRTIILAVIPCNVDIATQEILKLAEAADPEGIRTVGVLTKPDLATEMATKNAVMDLLLERRSKLKLGYYVVKNRSADDSTSTAAQRDADETAFFTSHPWSGARDRCGVAALKSRLSQLLSKISSQEIPHVKADIVQKLELSKRHLEAMGPSRANESAQRLYLGRLASRFQAVAQDALKGYYSGEGIFTEEPELRLITRILTLCENFSATFSERGQLDHFEEADEEAGSVTDAIGSLQLDMEKYDELGAVLREEEYECPEPVKGYLATRIREVYHSSRGPELGTFGGTILSAIFHKETEKWTPLTMSHVSKAVFIVHDFVYRLLTSLCPESQVKDQLWNEFLLDQLVSVYQKAVDQAQLLLDVERRGILCTFNHHFNGGLQKKRNGRLVKPLEDAQIYFSDSHTDCVSVKDIKKAITDKSNDDQVCDDILDALVSYYEVSHKRFVDVLCQQVVLHLLLRSKDGPLNLFGPELVMGLSSEQLDAIAGEDDDSKQTRQQLEREIANLEAAIKVLRG